MELHFPIILDGATGTQLQKKGYHNGICTEKWILEHPESIIEIQKSYIEAGSQIIYAPTFSANRVKLEENKIFNQVHNYNCELVKLSRIAADGQAFVAADIAPLGKFLAPMGDITFEEMFDIYCEQVEALEEAGVDLYVIETTMTIPEARAAVLAVKTLSQKPVFITFTCDEKGKTITGTDITAALLIMQGMGVDAFGLNCSVGPKEMLAQIKRLYEIAEIPLIAKPNAGLPVIENDQTIYKCSSEEFVEYTSEFAKYGVAIFGGCCGTDSSHIAALTNALNGIQISEPSPKYRDVLPAASEKSVFLLPPDVSCTTILNCDLDLEDNLDDAMNTDDPVIGIRISSEEDLENFSDAQYMISKPLCIFCEERDLLEEALKLYQGRALYNGNLDENTLKILQRKYGLIY